MSQLLTNKNKLQEALDILATKASGGEQATPEISVASSGLITATAGNKSSTYQLAFQAAKTITPSTASQIAVSSGHYTGGDIVVAGDSNLIAGNIKNGVSIFGISGTAEIGGETVVDDVSKAIIEGTITEIEDANITKITKYAFCDIRTLTKAFFPNCLGISASAFCQCSALKQISFPKCSTVGWNAFYNCSALKQAFFPECKTLGEHAFGYCFSLSQISFPICSIIGSYAFISNTGLSKIEFPVCTQISYNAFTGCDNLTQASFPACLKISSAAFSRCYILSKLQLGASSVCALSNSNAFYETPFAGYSVYFKGTPYIYVPSSLITAYQSATNWTYFSSYFSAIEDMGNNENDDNTSTEIIGFTISGTAYSAVNGMTWAEWVESEYNTLNAYIDSDMNVVFEIEDEFGPGLMVDLWVSEDSEGMSYVTATDLIVSKDYYAS